MNRDMQAVAQFILMLRKAGVHEELVLKAMEKIPREEFAQGAFSHRAFEDTALPIESGQTLSQPSIVGKMTQALNIGPRDKILEIGTGSGYQAAILSQLCRRVYTVERHPNLARRAQRQFDALGLHNITIITGDGTLGLPHQAPFDRIIVTAAAEDTPSNLLAQMKLGAIMVLPVGQSLDVQTLIKVTKTEDGFEYEEMQQVRFVPLIAG